MNIGVKRAAFRILRRQGLSAREAAYLLASGRVTAPIDGGLEQFRRKESRGVDPHRPALSYLWLRQGKQGFELAKTEMRLGYIAGDDRWPGMRYLQSTTYSEEHLKMLIDWKIPPQQSDFLKPAQAHGGASSKLTSNDS